MALRVADLVKEPMYVPRRAFYVIDGNQTAERFRDMHRLLNKNRAAQFWGVEEQWAGIHGKMFNSVVTRPNTLENKVIAIKYALRSVPDLDDFTADIAFNRSAKEILTDSKKIAIRKINAANTTKKRSKLPLTYGEAHNIPEIKNAAVLSLHENGDPTTEVVRSLEGWRYANKDQIFVSDLQLREGREAFDSLLLSSEKSPYVIELGKVATKFVQDN